MIKNIISNYKIQFLVAVALTMALLAMSVVREPLDIALIIIASLMGVFVLDLDYILYTYFIEPESDFSRTTAAFIQHKDFSNALQFIRYHQEEVKEKTLNSILFQLALAGLTIFVVSSPGALFIKALILSTFTNSIYRLAEKYFSNNYEDWFWALKAKPGKNQITIYLIVLLLILVYNLTIF